MQALFQLSPRGTAGNPAAAAAEGGPPQMQSVARAAVPRAAAARLKEDVQRRLDAAHADLQAARDAAGTAGGPKKKPDQKVVMEQCRVYAKRFAEQLNSVDVASRIRRSFGSDVGGLRHGMKMINFDRAFDDRRVDAFLRQGDGYQPHLVSPEGGLKLLMRDVLELARPPATKCVRDVHALLMTSAKVACDDAMYNASPGDSLISDSAKIESELNVHQCHSLLLNNAEEALNTWCDDAMKMVSVLLEMEQSHVSAVYFRSVTDAAARAIAPAAANVEVNRKATAGSSSSAGDAVTRRPSPPIAAPEAKEDGGRGSSSKQHRRETLDIDMEYLEKQNKHGVWQRRWFVLDTQRHSLFYYKEDKEHHSSQPRGRIDLLNAIVTDMKPPSGAPTDSKMAVVNDGESMSLLLGLSHKEKGKSVWKDHSTVVLRCPSLEVKFEWLAKLKAATSPVTPAALQGKMAHKTPEDDMPMTFESRDDDSENEEVASNASGRNLAISPRDRIGHADEVAVRARAYVVEMLNNICSTIPKAVVHLMVRRAERELVERLYNGVFTLTQSGLARLFSANEHEVEALTALVGRNEAKIAELEAAEEWLTRHPPEKEPGQANLIMVPSHVLAAAGYDPASQPSAASTTPAGGGAGGSVGGQTQVAEIAAKAMMTASQQHQATSSSKPPVPPRHNAQGSRRAAPPPPPSK